jgi:hypothetical protein
MSQDKSTAQPQAGHREKRHVGGDLIIPIAGLLFTFYYFSTILDSPWTAQVSAFFIGSVLIFLNLIFLIKTGIELRRGDVDLKVGAMAEPAHLTPTRLILLALTVGYIFVIQFAGFTLTTFLFMAAAMSLLTRGRNIGFIIALSAGFSFAGWALFIYAFKTRFPVGPFERLMEYLI